MAAQSFPVMTGEPAFEAQPHGVLSALVLGARRVVQFWPVLLLMLLGTLLSAGLLALIPALNLFGLAHQGVIAEMAAGIRAWQLIDLTGVISATRNPTGGNPLFNNLAILLVGFAIMPLVGGVVSAFLYGGVLLTYKEAQLPFRTGGVLAAYEGTQSRFRLGRFLWGCWHWFGGYLGLALIQALVFLILYLPLNGLVVYWVWLGPAAIAVVGLVVLLMALLWLMIFELARVRLVLNDTRNPFRGIGLAFGDLFRRPLALLGFYAAALLLLLGVQAVFRLLVNPNVPLDMLLLALAVQQGFILARLFCRALRLAGLMRLLS